MDLTLLSILACPKCRGVLEHVSGDAAEGLACASCSIVYPIEDDIPVLLVEEAVARPDWDAAAPLRKR